MHTVTSVNTAIYLSALTFVAVLIQQCAAGTVAWQGICYGTIWCLQNHTQGRLFAPSVCTICVQMLSLVCAGASWFGGEVHYSIDLTAAGVQCDSFCQDSTYPVVLHALPTSAAGQTPTAKHTAAVLAISLQVISS